MTETKQNSLGTEPIGRLLLKFSVPTALTLMVNCLYNIVDQIFIGHAVGIKGVAATNVTFPIGIIAAALALLIGDGCAANVSLHLGRGEQEEADRTFANAVMLLFGVGILLSVFGCIFARQLVVFFGASPSVVAEAVLYMSIILLGQPFGMCNMAFTAIIRADGNPQYMMRSMMIGAALNVVLDPIFIFVFRWGIQGAALATIIGQIVSGVIALAYLPRFSHFAIRKKYLQLKWRFIGDIVRLGFPSLCTQTATAATQIVMNNLMRKYGAATIYGSEIALSCYGLMMKIYQIAHAMSLGLLRGHSRLTALILAQGNMRGSSRPFRLPQKFPSGFLCCGFWCSAMAAAFWRRFLWRRNRSIRNLRCIASACICWASLSMDCQM